MHYNGQNWSAPAPPHPYPNFPVNQGGWPPPAGFAPQPGMPPYPGMPRSSNPTGWIVLGVVVVLVVAAVLALVVLRRGGGESELDKMKDAFPGLVQPVRSGVSGTGYDGHKCYHETAGSTLIAPHNDSLNLGAWTDAWDCWGFTDKPTYVVLAYPAQSDVRRVVDSLPPNEQSFSGSGYNGYRWQTPESATPVRYWKVEAFPSGARSRYLIIAQDEYWRNSKQGRDIHAFDRWCVAMPL